MIKKIFPLTLSLLIGSTVVASQGSVACATASPAATANAAADYCSHAKVTNEGCGGDNNEGFLDPVGDLLQMSCASQGWKPDEMHWQQAQKLVLAEVGRTMNWHKLNIARNKRDKVEEEQLDWALERLNECAELSSRLDSDFDKLHNMLKEEQGNLYDLEHGKSKTSTQDLEKRKRLFHLTHFVFRGQHLTEPMQPTAFLKQWREDKKKAKEQESHSTATAASLETGSDASADSSQDMQVTPADAQKEGVSAEEATVVVTCLGQSTAVSGGMVKASLFGDDCPFCSGQSAATETAQAKSAKQSLFGDGCPFHS